MKLTATSRKKAALFLVFLLLFELFPVHTYAITGGPSMPEYGSFEPVSTSNMVNNFNGSFVYNLPLLEVPNGYPINLSYNSSMVNNEALSSWVGLGWNINPGTITRSKSGFPDEYKAKKVKYYNRMPKNWTVSAGATISAEVFGNGLLSSTNGATISYNNYNGLGTSITSGLGFAGVANMNFSYSNGNFGFSPSISPGKLMKAAFNAIKELKSSDQKTEKKDTDKKERFKRLKAKVKNAKQRINKFRNNFREGGGHFKISSKSAASSSEPTLPMTINEYKGVMVQISFDVGTNILPIPLSPEVGVVGTYTEQTNIPSSEKTVYGYFHNDAAYDDAYAMMDYTTEMDKPYEQREKIIGYPLPNADVFSISGEGTGGSFRAYQSQYGHYRKNKIKSQEHSIIASADVESPIPNPLFVANTEFTAGSSTGYHYHFTEMQAWDDNEINDFKFTDDFSNSGEKYFFSYSGDNAGYFDLIGPTSNTYFRPNGTVNLDFSDYSSNNYLQKADFRSSGRHKQRSSYVLVHYNEDFDKTVTKDSRDIKYGVFEKDLHYMYGSNLQAYVHNSSVYDNANGIGEIVTYNTSGQKYVYGLPVYTRKERNLQYSFPGANGLSYVQNSEGLVAEVNTTGVDNNAKRKIGYEDNNAYAHTHLLTQVLSEDYIDRTGDGPSRDDFGSYTKFNYERIAGGAQDWYGYRSPYTGVSFNLGSLSINDDDMGSFSYGEKEVYFLHSVASKTHVAIFKTVNRVDGKSTTLSNNPSPDNLIKGTDGTSAKSLKRLDRIELYSLEDCTDLGHGFYEPNSGVLPIKTVRFGYSYGISNGLPNNSSSTGKLTLTKVWTEGGGAQSSKTNPYSFSYSYFTANYPSPYNGTTEDSPSYYNTLSLNENPDYTPANSDRWGNYRDYAALESTSKLGDLARFWPYVDQDPDADFDPAAYCLKRITLPTKGQIHIQYEQNDYQYVQNKDAMIMVPLSNQTSGDETGSNGKKYYLDLSKVGIDFDPCGSMTNAEKQELVNELFRPFLQNKERMYFNFLYALVGNNPQYDHTHTDYLDGYTKIDRVGYDDNGVFFTFKGMPSLTTGCNTGYLKQVNYSSGASKRELPRKVCLDFYKSQRRLKIDGGSNAATMENQAANGPGEELAQAFLNLMFTAQNGLEQKCREMDPTMSYVRVKSPVGNYRSGDKYYSKLGGGVRVKRLLMYTTASYGFRNSVYGSEYEYTDEVNGKKISSGVATNEPGTGRKENPFVQPLERNAQSSYEMFMYGRDMINQEEPVGESLMPAASIGYSKVVVRPIHKGSTATGYEEYTYYTAKEKPTFSSGYSHIRKSLLNDIPIGFSAGYGGISVSFNYKSPYLTQGLVFKLNDWHGKPKQIKKFPNGNNVTASSIETYEYYEEDEIVKLIGEDMKESLDRIGSFGREAEILSESRFVEDETFGLDVGVDMSGIGATMILGTIPAPVPGVYPSNIDLAASIDLNHLHTHSTSRVISTNAHVKKVTNTLEGISTVTENMAYDYYTGDPVITRKYDDVKKQDNGGAVFGEYIDQQFKSTWKYPIMTSKYQNEDLIIYPPSGGNIIGGSLMPAIDYIEFSTPNSSDRCGALSSFAIGDFLEVFPTSGATSKELFHVIDIDLVNNRLYIARSQYSEVQNVSSSIEKIHVITSGYKNRLAENMGAIQYFSPYGTPGTVTYLSSFDPSHPLAADLNTALAGVNTTQYGVILPGPYTGVDIRAMNYTIPAGCSSIDLSNATISDIEVDVIVNSNGTFSIIFKSFNLYCGTDDVFPVTCSK